MSEAATMTLTEINQLVDDLFTHETKASALRKQAEAENALAEELRRRILSILEATGLKSFKANAGTVTAATKFQVKFPTHDPEGREALRDYLQKTGQFEGLWSMNFQTLNGWYKEEMERAQAEGRYLDIPGLTPTSETYLQFRKGANG